MRLSVGFSLAVIAGLLVGLVMSRSLVTSTPATVSRAWAPPPPLPYDDGDMLQGREAERWGSWAQARAHYVAALTRYRTGYEAYSALARLDLRAGDYDGARRQLGSAIKAIERFAAYQNVLPRLYREMALASLAHSRHDEAHAAKHCEVALADLAKAKAAVTGVQPQMSYLIEMTTAEVEEKMSEVSAGHGDQKAARAHHANAEKHVNVALAIDQNDPRASFGMGPRREHTRKSPEKSGSTGSTPGKKGA